MSSVCCMMAELSLIWLTLFRMRRMLMRLMTQVMTKAMAEKNTKSRETKSNDPEPKFSRGVRSMLVICGLF